MLQRVSSAVGFAKELRALFQGEQAEKVRTGSLTGAEHKHVGLAIESLLHAKFGASAVFDWEGRDRPGRQQRSYPLLGTWTYPDAAVLAPFSLALEFDREPIGNDTAHFKTCLMKTACHVQSRAYEAALLVFTLSRPGSTWKTYLEDPTDPKLAHTREVLRSLRAQGLFIAFVPAPSS